MMVMTMPRNDRVQPPIGPSPYHAGENTSYVIEENKFTLYEPRIREIIGSTYDLALKENPVPSVSWRDILTGAFLAALSAFVYEANKLEWRDLGALWVYIAFTALFFTGAVCLWLSQGIAWFRSRNNPTKREKTIACVFDSIVEISKRDSPYPVDENNCRKPGRH
jgi:hypothetical protein